MAEARIPDFDENRIDTILAEDIDFTGELSFDDPLMIKGTFRGVINASGDLYVGEHARLEATLEAGQVSSKGAVVGDITARRRVELYATATVDGDITTPDLVVESGCRFNGSCTMAPGGGSSNGGNRPSSSKDDRADQPVDREEASTDRGDHE